MQTRALAVGTAGVCAAALFAGSLWASPTGGPSLEELEAACATDNPYLVMACYPAMNSSTRRASDPMIVAFRDSRADDSPVTIATLGDVGAVWGLAHRGADQALYAAAYHKRQAPFGPGGPGAIYRIDMQSGASSVAITVPSAGDDHHSAGDDHTAADHVGKTSLGGIDLSPDESQLFVMNLGDRAIYRFSLPDGALLGRIEHGASAEPWAEDARPFAVKVYEDHLYHGVVNSAESSRRRSDLAAHVYRSDLVGGDMTLVASAPLNFARGRANSSIRGLRLDWQVWRSGRQADNSTPLVTDIEFVASGAMALGFRDRQSDTTHGFTTVNPRTGLMPDLPAAGFGDVLHLALVDGTWTSDTRREFYADRTRLADESIQGGLAALPGLELLAAGALGLRTSGPGSSEPGAVWFETATGTRARQEIMCEGPRNAPRTGGNESEPQLNAAAQATRDAGAARLEPLVTKTPRTPIPPKPYSVAGPSTIGDLEVVCSEPIPPTPTPTFTSTPTPSATSTPTSTSTATPTSTRVPEPIYLPMLIRELCKPGFQHSDIAMVIDASTSMAEHTAAGRSKLEAAVAAARAFINHLDLEADQAAIVQFNGAATLLQPLTGELTMLSGALNSIAMQPQTRIDLGIEVAKNELTSPRHRDGNNRVMVVLTDGRNNPEPISTAVQRAAEAKAEGIRVFSIGLGLDVETEALQEIASNPEDYFFAPDGENLASIYEQIAHAIPCPPDGYWPKVK